ncbi:hypothetical protein Hanom_Chr17g01572821 [Helianthus anomalus]
MALTWATRVHFGRATRRNERENELHLICIFMFFGLFWVVVRAKKPLFPFLCFLDYFGHFVLARVFGPLCFLGQFRISVLIYMSL